MVKENRLVERLVRNIHFFSPVKIRYLTWFLQFHSKWMKKLLHTCKIKKNIYNNNNELFYPLPELLTRKSSLIMKVTFLTISNCIILYKLSRDKDVSSFRITMDDFLIIELSK